MNMMEKVLRKAKALHKIKKKTSNPVRWGVMGTGYMAETLCSAIDGNANGIVCAVASRSKDRASSFAKKHGKCIAYGSYQELVADKSIDIIYIATPTICHYENIKLCLEAGKNVLCEKPITSCLAELIELKNLAKANNCFLMEGMWMKCLPTYQKAVEWIKTGKIGEVELIKADFYKREKIRPEAAIYNAEMGGGVLKDYGVYAVSFPLGFMDTICVVEGKSRQSKFGIDADWQIYLSDGTRKAFINISSNFSSQSKAAVIGKNGTIEWESQFNRTHIISLYDANGSKIESIKWNYVHEGFEYELDEVHASIKKGLKESPVVTLESSMKTLEIIDNLLKGKMK